MRTNKNKPSKVWLRQAQPRSQMHVADLSQFVQLKRQAKKIGIITRMQNRVKTNVTSFSQARPRSTISNRPNNRPVTKFKELEDMFEKQKSLTRAVLAEEDKGSRCKEGVGLLGEWSRYESMEKRQLIEKLISLQHLANAIFKRNKFLQEQLKNKQKQ